MRCMENVYGKDLTAYSREIVWVTRRKPFQRSAIALAQGFKGSFICQRYRAVNVPFENFVRELENNVALCQNNCIEGHISRGCVFKRREGCCHVWNICCVARHRTTTLFLEVPLCDPLKHPLKQCRCLTPTPKSRFISVQHGSKIRKKLYEFSRNESRYLHKAVLWVTSTSTELYSTVRKWVVFSLLEGNVWTCLIIVWYTTGMLITTYDIATKHIPPRLSTFLPLPALLVVSHCIIYLFKTVGGFG